MPIPRQVFVIAIATAISLLGDTTLYVVLPTHADQLGINLAFVGILLSINRFVRLFTNSIAGYVFDHMGEWWHFVAALALGACTTTVYGLFWGIIAVFLIARIVWGACWSFLRLEGYATVIQYGVPENRGTLMGVYTSVSSVGFFAGSLLGGLFTDMIGFRSTLLIFAGLTLLGACVTFLELSRHNAATRTQRRQSETDDQPDAGHSLKLDMFWLKQWMRENGRLLRQHASLYYSAFINVLVNGSITSSTLGLLLHTRFRDGLLFRGHLVRVATLTGFLLALRWCVSFFGSPLLGHVSDKVTRKFVLRFGLLVGMIALVILVTQVHIVWIGGAALLSSMSRAAVSVSLDAAITDVASKGRRGKTIGLYTTVTDLGSAMGPLVSFLVSAWIGSELGLARIYAIGIALLLSAIGTSALRERGR